jgi:hypothetical protein
MFEKIQKWYNQGLWTKEMVKNAFNKGVITEVEYMLIIGELNEN